jgi:predicted nucleotidyltransferase component of viral defense system
MHRECFSENGWKILSNLKDIFNKHNAVLAGGTALALHLGHRISMDLDFFTVSDFNTDRLLSEIRKMGQTFRLISEGEGFLFIEVENIKVSMFKYEYPFVEKPVKFEGIEVASVLDIASMKVVAISQRGTKRDFVDLYFILQDIPFHKIAKCMVKRFGKERINHIHIGKSLVYFSDAESHPEPEFLKGKDVSWDKVKEFFRNHVKQIVYDLEISLNDK